MSVAERQAPAHVVIVTPEAWGVTGENGGISTSVVHFARLFRRRGDRVTLLVGVAKEQEPDPTWANRYDRDGIELVAAVAAQGDAPALGRYGLEFPFRRISEAVADALPADADVVYFQDWSALGFEYLRRRGPAADNWSPIAVTILRSCSKWVREGAQRPPEDFLAEGRLDFAERFATERSDFVVSPSDAYRDWLEAEGARLQEDGRTRLLAHPWLPPDDVLPAPPPSAQTFHRLVLFGRLETLKGFDLFLDSLRLLYERRPDLLAGLDEIVFLGREGTHRQSSLDSVAAEISSFGVDAVFSTDLDSWGAQRYLAAIASDSLTVIPSLRENFCYTAIEASLVPGLNLICSDVGGIPEVLAMEAREQLFSPRPQALCDALERWLERGPRPASELVSYDWETANDRWLAFHEELLEPSRSATHLSRSPAAFVRAAHRVQNEGLSVVISTYEWPEALDAVLRALSEQSDDRFDVVVADDGSGAGTAAVVDRWETALGERLTHAWQPDQGFRLARVRNLGAATARGSYLVFIDGDCVPRPHFVAAIRRAALSGWFLAGKRVQMSPELSRAVTEKQLAVARWSTATFLLRARGTIDRWMHLTARDRRRPWRTKLPDFAPDGNAYGFLTGVARADFELVNGFDTRFVGWGDQDVDLAVRLRRLGLRCGYAGPRATMLHLWHPTHVTRDRDTWWLLQETERSDRIQAVEGLRELGPEPAVVR